MKKKKNLLRFIAIIVLVIVVGLIVINRQWIYDFFRGVSYSPSSEMIRIRDDLNLTERGEFLFNATWPELNLSDDFNSYCRKQDEEIAILGCYMNGNIYVYNITSSELDGIRELTTAHELLHAVFARMSEDEKLKLRPYLLKVYNDNINTLKEDLESYSEEEKFEEIYVRAGTEIKDLSETLEKHYAEIFKDQDSIVDFYNSYIAIFKEIESEMEQLMEEMESLQSEIESKTEDYEKRLKQLETDILNFNECAGSEGCFSSNSEFYNRRSSLTQEKNALEELYQEIDGLIDSYNEKVEKYNTDVTRTEKLNEVVNSNSKPSGVE